MRNLKTGIIYIYFLLRITIVYSQAPEIDWQISSGGSDWDEAHSVVSTPDSGYIAVGYTASTDGDITESHGDWDFWITKLDTLGNLQWQKTYGGSSADNAYSIINDGSGYVVAGYTYSSDGDVTGSHGIADVWVIKIDYSGNLIWKKCYGGSSGDYATSIKKTNGGGYIIAARSSSSDGDVSGSHGGGDVWIIKIDDLGNIEWEKCYGGSGLDVSWDIVQTNSGDYVVVGSTFSFDGDVETLHGLSDFWIISIDTDGVLNWERSFGGSNSEEAFSVLEDTQNNLYIGGHTYSSDFDITYNHGEGDVWLIKTDSVGNLITQKTFGGSSAESIYSLNWLESNNLIFIGETYSDDGDVTFNQGSMDYWIALIDSNFVLCWQKTLGGSGIDRGNSISETYDGGFICTGRSNSVDGDISGNHGDFDFWTVKLQKPCDQTTYYFDVDEDTFGDPSNYFYSCVDTSGYVLNNLDCDDLAASINPLSEEECNNNDDNCDGLIDNGLVFTNYYLDADNDTYGNFDVDTLWCNPVEGYITDSTDCDDSNPLINPGMVELLNGLDDDCDGLSDEGLLIAENIIELIKIFPNPAADFINIELSNSSIAEIEIIDITGKIILQKQMFWSPEIVNIERYIPGIYVVKVSTDKSHGIFNFIKL